jgi:hypothetical protein
VRDDGTKGVSPGAGVEWHKSRYTKMKFYWQNGVQRQVWITYQD